MIPSIRGTHDILPGEVEKWQYVEHVARSLCERYGYVEVRTPIIEREELFSKGTGETTDIVQKEMYSFTDKGGDRVTLRPEATPSMVRAYVEHSLEHALPVDQALLDGPDVPVRAAAEGPVSAVPSAGRRGLRHGRSGRGRRSHRPGVESRRGARHHRRGAGVNSVGCAACRPRFHEALLAALGDDLPKLCQDCQRRAATNPLRIYDCKVEADQPIIDRLPHAVDYLCEPCATHFKGVQTVLDGWGLPWRLSHRLVRGLDYYTRTTFEILGLTLGAQNALLGGGRYDGLVKALGGPDRTGIGFAAGLERLVLALPDGAAPRATPRVFVVAMGEESRAEALRLLRELRQAGVAAQMEFEARSLKAQMKRADRAGGARDVHRRRRRAGAG